MKVYWSTKVFIPTSRYVWTVCILFWFTFSDLFCYFYCSYLINFWLSSVNLAVTLFSLRVLFGSCGITSVFYVDPPSMKNQAHTSGNGGNILPLTNKVSSKVAHLCRSRAKTILSSKYFDFRFFYFFGHIVSRDRYNILTQSHCCCW